MTDPAAPWPDPDRWLHPDVAAAPSRIAGRGLFTAAQLGAGTVVAGLGDTEGAAERVGNHSCDPNLGFDGSGAELVARRDIAAGEELTVDYAMFVTDPSYVLYCHCETYRCRQVVEGTDWRIPQLQQRYVGHWAPAVRELIEDAAGPG